MHISSIASSFPERKISNNEIVNLLKENSQKTYTEDLDLMLTKVKKTLEYTGIKTRRWLAKNENPFVHIEKVINEALSQANMKKEDIEVLIFAGLDKRVIEPGFSFFIAKTMGFKEIECFDVTEACNTWTRAVIIADSFLKSKRNKTTMIISSEFYLNEKESGFNNFSLKKEKDLNWAFPTFTLGESATAVILTGDQSKNLKIKNVAYPEYAHLCLAPYDEYNDITGKFKNIDLRGAGRLRFVSYGAELQKKGWELFHNLCQKDSYFGNFFEEEKCDIFFPHAQAIKVWQDFSKSIGKNFPYYFIYQDYGNLITNSIPGAMSLALKEKKLKRGDKVFALVPAAGMSFSLYSFIF
jgi:3-oxoacyl-[acyl-carrier-protein] synthase III